MIATAQSMHCSPWEDMLSLHCQTTHALADRANLHAVPWTNFTLSSTNTFSASLSYDLVRIGTCKAIPRTPNSFRKRNRTGNHQSSLLRPNLMNNLLNLSRIRAYSRTRASNMSTIITTRRVSSTFCAIASCHHRPCRCSIRHYDP